MDLGFVVAHMGVNFEFHESVFLYYSYSVLNWLLYE